MNKVLILGNGPDINEIDFTRLKGEVKTAGVNRIWLKHFPDYLFYHDPEIMWEIEMDPFIKYKLIAKCKCYASDWIYMNTPRPPAYLNIVNRRNRKAFVDSVTTFMRILIQENVFSIDNTIFYIAGMAV